jgi:type VI secretion system protein ImpL
MKQKLFPILKGLLVLALVALAVLLVFGVVLLIGWPWWVALFLLAGLVGLTLAALVLRKYLGRRREQMFVHQVIAQDESRQQRMAPEEQSAAAELQARWKEAVDTLRHSHMRKHGNPLYVLPWYMVIGESGSGKTTAIQSARLSSPFAEMTRTSGISGTRNCDWWFFEQAIVLDTAGRYAIAVDEARDMDEWQKFLHLLARFRKKEPLNGLVVTVAADHLAQSPPETLLENGRSIRGRIDELMRALGAKFPVYVLVTKCDLIQGATHFCDALPETALNQAMGLLNQQLGQDSRALTDKVFRTVGDRLRDLRLLLLHQGKKQDASPSMLLFPEEYEKLKDALAAFVDGAFQENPYQESPLLRGIFFSSGRQEGTPYSHFLNALGLVQNREVLPGTNKGLFLHDFFAKILPRDRHLFTPTQHMAQWKRLTRNMGLTSWIAVMLAACGLLSYSFVKNLNALSDVRREFGKPAVLQDDLLSDVITMDRYRQALFKVETGNAHWWIPRLGLNESLQVETDLKQKFVTLFHNGFLNAFDKSLDDRLARFSADTPGKVFGAHVVYLARRINLLKARLAGENLERLGARPQPDYTSAVLGRDTTIPEIQGKIAEQYLCAVAWQEPGGALNQELAHLQTWLKHLLSMPGVTLNWLTEWVNTDPSLAPVRLNDFWGGREPDEQNVMVPAALTMAGKSKIDATVAEIEAALFDPLIIAESKAAFAKWYDQAYISAWQNFVRDFGEGRKMLKDREQWQALVKRVPTRQGPYDALIARLGVEFEPVGRRNSLPAWVQSAIAWQAICQDAAGGGGVNPAKSGLLEKAKRKITGKTRRLGVSAGKFMDAKEQIQASQACLAYQTALKAMAKSADSPKVAFQLASDLYQQDPATGDSPFLVAHRAVQEIRAAMKDSGDPSQALFWDLLNGNIGLMQQYADRETACLLQNKWETDVLMDVQNVADDTQMAKLMMGANGLAGKFIHGPAAPFITRSLQQGYYAKPALDMEIPFKKKFLDYLTKGAKAALPTQSSYRITVRAYPTDANPGATVQPHATVLDLQCADGNVHLENLNYPVSKTFVWSPQNCGDVLFQISVGSLRLTKQYSGHYAFAKFLNDFKTGRHTFHRREFPNEQAALRRMGIKYIRAKYRFQGHKPALQLLYSAPGRPPQEIATCQD